MKTNVIKRNKWTGRTESALREMFDGMKVPQDIEREIRDYVNLDLWNRSQFDDTMKSSKVLYLYTLNATRLYIFNYIAEVRSFQMLELWDAMELTKSN